MKIKKFTTLLVINGVFKDADKEIENHPIYNISTGYVRNISRIFTFLLGLKANA